MSRLYRIMTNENYLLGAVFTGAWCAFATVVYCAEFGVPYYRRKVKGLPILDSIPAHGLATMGLSAGAAFVGGLAWPAVLPCAGGFLVKKNN